MRTALLVCALFTAACGSHKIAGKSPPPPESVDATIKVPAQPPLDSVGASAATAQIVPGLSRWDLYLEIDSKAQAVLSTIIGVDGAGQPLALLELVSKPSPTAGRMAYRIGFWSMGSFRSVMSFEADDMMGYPISDTSTKAQRDLLRAFSADAQPFLTGKGNQSRRPSTADPCEAAKLTVSGGHTACGIALGVALIACAVPGADILTCVPGVAGAGVACKVVDIPAVDSAKAACCDGLSGCGPGYIADWGPPSDSLCDHVEYTYDIMGVPDSETRTPGDPVVRACIGPFNKDCSRDATYSGIDPTCCLVGTKDVQACCCKPLPIAVDGGVVEAPGPHQGICRPVNATSFSCDFVTH
jgi:hypothetical protein